MHWLSSFIDKLKAFWEKVRPGFQAVGRFFRKLGKALGKIGHYLYLMRSLILGAPVAAAAVVLASRNMDRLPKSVEVTKIAINTKAPDALFGFLELSTAAITRDAAVYGPVILTAACLLMMIFSKRTLYPFLVALFSLCLPIALYYFTVFPC